MLKMNVSNMCKEVHRVRVLYVHVFVSVYNFLRWNKIIKYKKKTKKKKHRPSVTRTAVSLYTLYSINKKPSSEFKVPHFSSPGNGLQKA